MKKRILWINPLGTSAFDEPMRASFATEVEPDVRVDVVSLGKGPEHLEYHYYEALVLPDILHAVKRAENQGYDGAIIGCFYDPGLREAREIVRDMVIAAPAEAALHVAATLGDTFSIIVGRRKWIPAMRENVDKYGFGGRLASFKSLGMGVPDFHADERRTMSALIECAKEAVEKDRAEVIVLGCTIEFGFYKEIQRIVGVPVIDATLAPLKYAEFLIEIKKRFGWGHSKEGGYESPPVDEILSWGLDSDWGTAGLWKE